MLLIHIISIKIVKQQLIPWTKNTLLAISMTLLYTNNFIALEYSVHPSLRLQTRAHRPDNFTEGQSGPRDPREDSAHCPQSNSQELRLEVCTTTSNYSVSFFFILRTLPFFLSLTALHTFLNTL